MDDLKEKRQSPWTSRFAAMSVGLGLGMAILVLPIWWNRIKTLDKFNDDFAAFYTAAKLDFASLYNLDKQHAVQRRIISESHHLPIYFYPPFFAVALKPLALLGFRHAYIALSTMNLTFLALSLGMLIRKLNLGKLQIRWFFLLTFTNFGIYVALLKGQTAFISLILFVLCFIAVIDSEDPLMCQLHPSARYRAGVWAALLCFKPSLAVVPLVVLIAKRKWESLIAFLITVASLSGISLALVGWHGIAANLDILKRVGADNGYIDYGGSHDNIRAIIYFFVSSSTIRTLVWAGASTILLWLVIFYARQPSSDSKAWTIISLSALLVAPYLYGYDLTLLLLPTAFFLKWVGDEISPGIVLALVAPGTLLFMQATPISLPPLAPLALVGFLIWILQKENSACLLRLATGRLD